MTLHVNPSRRFRWLTRIGFVLALLLTLFFGARVVMNTIYWSDPRHVDEAIEGWMPLGYIARSWDVPHEVIFDAVDIQANERRWRRLERIAESRGIPVETLATSIEQAIEAYRVTGGGAP